jgi:hypothetical protein
LISVDSDSESEEEDEDELADDWEEFRKEIRKEMEDEERKMELEATFEGLREELYLRSVENNPFYGIFINEIPNSDPAVDSLSEEEDFRQQAFERARLDELLRRRVHEAEALSVLRQGEERL